MPRLPRNLHLVTKCHTCHAKRSDATLKNYKMLRFAELTIGTAIATWRERLRTVADGCERLRNVWRAQLNPQPPEWTGNPCCAFGKNVHPNGKLVPNQPLLLSQIGPFVSGVTARIREKWSLAEFPTIYLAWVCLKIRNMHPQIYPNNNFDRKHAHNPLDLGLFSDKHTSSAVNH